MECEFVIRFDAVTKYEVNFGILGVDYGVQFDRWVTVDGKLGGDGWETGAVHSADADVGLEEGLGDVAPNRL